MAKMTKFIFCECESITKKSLLNEAFGCDCKKLLANGKYKNFTKGAYIRMVKK